jgi:hypothetical protein
MTFLIGLFAKITGSAIFGTIGGWLKALFDWLRTLPWYDFAIAAAIGFGAIQHIEARHWHKIADRQKATIDGMVNAQAAATKAAKINQAVKAAGHADNSKEIVRENESAHAGADSIVSALRLRIKDIERRGKPIALPGAGDPAAVPDAQVDFRLSLADELALRRQCDAIRIDHDSLIDWESRRIAIESTPVPAIQPATEESH